MKLFTSFIPQVQHVLVHGRWFSPSVVVLFAGLEMYGRQATSDVHDTVGAIILMMILGGITVRHRSNPIRWVKGLGAMTWFVARFGDRFKLELGPDLKGSPTLPRRLPFAFYLVVTALVCWVATAAGVWWLLPDDTKQQWLSAGSAARIDSIEARFGATGSRRERFLGRVLTFDDDVAEALYSKNRSVRAYRPSDVTELRNNYNGRTPTAGYLSSWQLTLAGLASGKEETLTAGDLLRLPSRDQVTRLCCVEGWSAIAFWSGIPFAELLRAYPPAPAARWAAIESAVNLDGAGRPDPYYVSIDLDTARHPQTLLATRQNREPLSVAHGAPLRLVAPMKLGLKNIKAITSIRYSADEPRDYWNERGYSRYDGL